MAYLLDRAYWGQGLATEAAGAIAEYAIHILGLKRLICLIDEGNIASRRVAEKIGLTYERDGEDEKGAYLLYSRSSSG